MRCYFVLASAIVFVAALACATPAVAQTGPSCQRTANALPAEQRAKLTTWIKRDPAAQDLTVDHLCIVDAKSVVVALVDFNGLESAVHLVSFGEGPTRVRKLWSGAIDAASLLRPPGGGLKLVFANQAAQGRAFQRRAVLLDIETGKSEILASGTIDPSGSCKGARLLRLYPRVADVNRDKQPDIVIEREEIGCDQEKSARRQENFLADGPGYRRQ